MNTLFFNYVLRRGLSFLLTFWIIFGALATGLIFSILSWMELCVEHCAANHDWKLFGLPFGFVGIPFFTVLLGLHAASRKYPSLTKYVGWMIAGSFGAEIMFIIIQKVQIGHWCPVCLTIAASITVAGITLAINWATQLFQDIQLKNRGAMLTRIKQGLSSFSFIILGFAMAFLGTTKADGTEAAMKDIKDQMAFGNKNSSIEIYLFTDWFCPGCRKIDPIVEKFYPKIKANAAFYFIDYPIHKKSLNFTPYNLAFMVNNKADYFKARHVLHELSESNESPNDDDIIKAAQKQGLILRELSFLSVKNGMEFADTLVKKFDLNSTPTLVILNTQNNRTVKLEGSNEITEDKVLKGIDKVRQLSKK